MSVRQKIIVVNASNPPSLQEKINSALGALEGVWNIIDARTIYTGLDRDSVLICTIIVEKSG